MATKRALEEDSCDMSSDQDPDYAMVTSIYPAKRQKLHQQDAKETTIRKIEGIIKKQFSIEMKNKEKEVELIDERIHQVRVMLDKLRACIVADYYGNAGSYPTPNTEKLRKADLNHPAIQRALGQTTPASSDQEGATKTADTLVGKQILEPSRNTSTPERLISDVTRETTSSPSILTAPVMNTLHASRFHIKKRIIVGNVSKYITADSREDSDPSTHKWMVYVRGPPEEPRIDHFVKKVWFFLHPSYRPNDLVEVKDPPFHLTRRGWGEFPIRVQLHFTDSKSKKVDIIHHLKLDRTYTGLQTLGAETVVDVDLDRLSSDDVNVKQESRPSTPTVTRVNYREGYKPGLSRTPPSMRSSPSLYSGQSSKGSMSPQDSESQLFPSPQDSEFSNLMDHTPSPSPGINEGSLEDGLRTAPTFCEDRGMQEVVQPSPSGLTNKVQIQSGKIISSSGSPNIKQKEGQFIQVMPNADAAKENTRETQILGLEVLNQENALGGALPKVSTGKGGVAIRICGGKMQGVSPTGAKGIGAKPLVPGLTSLNPTQSVSSGPITAREMLSALKASSLASSGQTAVKPGDLPTSQKSQGVSVKSLLGAHKTSTGVTLLPSTPTTTSGSNQQTLPLVSNPPPGTQYYITAKSTDPNLQGKVILIPHQVFAQASAQQTTKAGKGRGKSTITKPTAAGGKTSFLSPSNVLILPQGSIVPPLPPGSIVQIQQVSSPARGSTVQTLSTVKSPTQAKPKTQTVVTSVKAQPSVTKPSPGGIIQIQRTSSGQSVAKIIQTQSVAKGTTSSGVSLLPEMKSQLARTPSGGVILVQRMANQAKGTNTQVSASIPKLKLSQGNAANQVLSSLNSTAQPSASKVPSQTKILPGQTIILQSPATSPTRLKNTKTVHLVQSQGKRYMTDGGQSGSISSNRTDQLMASGGSVPTVKSNTTSSLAGLPSSQMGASKLLANMTIGGQPLLPLPGLTPIQKPGLTVTPSNVVTKIKIEPREESVAAPLKPLSAPAANTSLSVGHMSRDCNSTLAIVTPCAESTLVVKNSDETNQELIPKLPGLTKIVVKEESLETGEDIAENFTKLQSTDLEEVLQDSGKSQLQVSEEGETLETSVINVSKNQSPEIQTTEGDVVKVKGKQDKILISKEITSSETSSLKSVIKEELMESVDQEIDAATVVNVSPAVMGPNTILSATHKSDSNVNSIPSTSPLAPPSVVSLTQNAPLISSLPAVGSDSPSVQKSKLVNSADSDVLPLIKIKKEPPDINEYDSAPSNATSTIFIATPTVLVPPLPQHKLGVFENRCLKDKMSKIHSKKDRGVSLCGVKTMEDLVCAVVKQKPLVKEDRDIVQLPYCAKSLEIFQSWPYGKRRAAEWQRALNVRMTVMFLIPRLMCLWNQDIWSTKKIMLWCRRYGYTPVVKAVNADLKKLRCNLCGAIKQKEGDMHECKRQWLTDIGFVKNPTHSLSKEFCCNLKQRQRNKNKEDLDSLEIIDIVTPPSDTRRPLMIKQEIKVEEGSKEEKEFIPASNGARLVQDEAHKIGVHFKPLLMEENIYCPLSEETIFAATRCFLDALLHGAYAAAYEQDSSQPEEIFPLHVFQSIAANRSFDFLTNTNLGVLTEIPGASTSVQE